MSKLVQFTGVRIPDLHTNSCDNLNNMKLDLNVSTKVWFRANDQTFSLKVSVITGFFYEFCSVSFKEHSPVHLQK